MTDVTGISVESVVRRCIELMQKEVRPYGGLAARDAERAMLAAFGLPEIQEKQTRAMAFIVLTNENGSRFMVEVSSISMISEFLSGHCKSLVRIYENSNHCEHLPCRETVDEVAKRIVSCGT